MQFGATWCSFVQLGATWCSLVQLDTDWCMHGCIRFVSHILCQSRFMFHSKQRGKNII